MGILRRSSPTLVAALAVLVVSAACNGAPLADRAASPVMGSGSDSLPPPTVRHARTGEVLFVRTAAQGENMPPPPPPPGGGPVVTDRAWSTPAPVPAAQAPGTAVYAPQAAMTAPAVPLAQRCWSGCGLPCEDKVSQWHVRALGGYAIYTGIDKPDACGYFGVDLGRTFCGCWGMDVFYRVHGCRFDRENDAVSGLTVDGGNWHHIGLKFNYQRSIAGSRFYWFAGGGATYWWNDGYLESDTGVGPFGEVGLGYVIANNWKVFLGLDLHGMRTNTGRLDPVFDRESRWIWVWAPMAGVEFSW